MSEHDQRRAAQTWYRKEEMTADGFRSAASSILNECGPWHDDAVERQPAQVDNDCVRRACARAGFCDELARMMTWRLHRCCELQAGGIVVLRA